MRRTFLRWLIPVVLYSVFVATVLGVFKTSARNIAIHDAWQTQVNEIDRALYKADVNIKAVQDVTKMAAEYCEDYDFKQDSDKICKWLSYIIDKSYASSVVLCDSEGYGYSESGKRTSIVGEPFFDDMVSYFGNGGNGMIFLGVYAEYDSYQVAYIVATEFVDGSRGYVISYIDTENLPNQIFGDNFKGDLGYIVAYDGSILVSSNGILGTGDGKAWDTLPGEVPVEAIKNSISNKIEYTCELKGHGYLTVSPSMITQGGAIVYTSYETMDKLIAVPMSHTENLLKVFMIATVVLVLLLILADILSDRLEIYFGKRRREKRKIDELTGLLEEESAERAIDEYLKLGGTNGLLFVMAIDGADEIRISKGEEYIDKAMLHIATELKTQFRITDVISRSAEDEFFVFLKDIETEKDIRKQTDDMQMFIHDLKEEGMAEKYPIKLNVGAAILPKDGSSGKEIVFAGRKAIERMKSEQKGTITFYH